jgi:hypothetical protein
MVLHLIRPACQLLGVHSSVTRAGQVSLAFSDVSTTGALKPVMKYNDLVQLFFERSNALQTFWTIWVAVVGALLAFCAARRKLGLWMMCILTVGFCLFACVNLFGMRDVSAQRLAAMKAMKDFPPPAESNKEERQSLEAVRKTIEDSLNPPTVGVVTTFHLLVDLLVLVAIWVISYRKEPAGGSR